MDAQPFAPDLAPADAAPDAGVDPAPPARFRAVLFEGGAVVYDGPDLVEANQRARASGRRCTVVRVEPDGGATPMSYSGPGGWSGGQKRRAYQAWGVKRRRRAAK